MYSVADEKSFISWMRENNELFTGNEYQARLGVFISNQRLVQEHNSQNKGFNVEMNKFAALTPAEYRSLLGFKPIVAQRSGKASMPINDVEIDWRTKGAVSNVQDQGQCGSCWAFSAIQAVETCSVVHGSKLLKLSEQQLVDCDTTSEGCNGGLMTTAYEYVIKNQKGGFMLLADYPYTARKGNCKFNEAKIACTIKGYTEIVEGSEADLAAKCQKFGAIAIAIDASNWSFQMYSSGIYDEARCSAYNLDHGVGCVGYGSEGDKKYWIVRNSWGPSWGEKGYIRMAKDKKNQCGQATMACYPTF